MADNGEGTPLGLKDAAKAQNSIAENNPASKEDKVTHRSEQFLKKPDYSPTPITNPSEAQKAIATHNPDTTTNEGK